MTMEQGGGRAVHGPRPALSLRRRRGRAMKWVAGAAATLLAIAGCSSVRQLPADPAVDLEAGATTQILTDWS